MMLKIFSPMVCLSVFLQCTAFGIDYKTDVLPIIKEHCADCHQGAKAKNGYDFISLTDLGIRANIGKYNIIRPGDIEEGTFLGWMLLPESHSDFMPRKGKKVPDEELNVIKKWILAGAIVDSKNLTEEEKKRVPDLSAFHKWTNKQNVEIVAKFSSIKDESVKIIMKNGTSYEVPFSKLSEESVELAKKLATFAKSQPKK